MTSVYDLHELRNGGNSCDMCGGVATLAVSGSKNHGTPHHLCGKCLEVEYPKATWDESRKDMPSSSPNDAEVIQTADRLGVSAATAKTLLSGK